MHRYHCIRPSVDRPGSVPINTFLAALDVGGEIVASWPDHDGRVIVITKHVAKPITPPAMPISKETVTLGDVMRDKENASFFDAKITENDAYYEVIGGALHVHKKKKGDKTLVYQIEGTRVTNFLMAV